MSTTVQNRDKRVERAQTSVIFKVPFFAPGVARLPVRWLDDAGAAALFGPDPQTWTACTDGQCIKWHTGYFDRLTDPQLVTVLCHETCHCLLGHAWRAPEGCDWDLWNQACDHAVNLLLKDWSAQVMAKRLADPLPFPEPAEAYCANPAFAGMAEEVIYGRLASSRPPAGGKRPPGTSKPGGGSNAGQGGANPQASTKPGKAPGKGAPKPGQGQPAPGSMPSFGQFSKPPNGGQAGQQKALANDWASTMIQSVKLGSGQGTLLAGLERYVDGLVNPRVPWQEILRSWLREQAFDDWDFMKPAVEYEASGLMPPSLAGEKMGTIVFATDTSGSINGELLSQFQTEKQTCLDSMRPRKLVDIYCDAHIHKAEEYSPGDEITRQCPGGGGTDFRPVFDYVAKMDTPPKALVYLTDLCGTFPADEPGIPVIWVTWEKGGTAPFGEVVYAGD